MRKLTVKDFIEYSNPCFICHENVELAIRGNSGKISDNYKITPNYASNSRLDFLLHIGYFDTLNLSIFHKTNEYLTNDNNQFNDFLSEHQLFISTRCMKCHSCIESQYLEFNTSKRYIGPLGISNELFYITDNSNYYILQSRFISNISTVTYSDNEQSHIQSPELIEVPLLPREHFKNKQELIEQLKVYILFS